MIEFIHNINIFYDFQRNLKLMKYSIGVLSINTEIAEELSTNYSELSLIIYKSIDAIRKEDFSLLLVDIEFFESPDTIQFLLSRIRKKVHESPVILINRVHSIHQMRSDWFIDDFIIYPFRKGELIARIGRLFGEKELNDEIILLGPLKINLNEYSVSLKNQKLELTYKEFELLRLLSQNRGTVFSRKDLLIKIWGVEYIGGTRTVDVHIRRLRGKLGSEFDTIIETVRNVGYRCKE